MRHLVVIVIALLSLAAAASEPLVEFVTPSIVRVRWNPDGTVTDNATGVCVYEPATVSVTVDRRPGLTVITSDSLIVAIPDYPGGISFIDRATGDTLLREQPYLPRVAAREFATVTVYDDESARMEDTANGKVTVKDVLRRDTVSSKTRYVARFLTSAGEGIYGLGSHMEDYMNLLGKTLYLTQHNLKAFVPVIVSTGGYGLLFDAGCSMQYKSSPIENTVGYEMRMELEAADILDYYFIKGTRPRDVVAGYRYLTGDVSMMPLYLFGYIQSKERYVSSDDIIGTVREYRRRRVPLDMIVQDWNYWPQGWGYMKMNRDFYPDPKALADSVHALDAKLMVSIWANPQYCPEEQDFRAHGYMLEHSVYDAFNPAARDLYWEYAYNEFFSNGFDAWWCDSSEPLDGDWNQLPEPDENGRPYSRDDHYRRWLLNDQILSETLGAGRACLYSLNHSRGIYEHQRQATDRKRVVNLTRSTFAGQQRYGTIVWNGDTHASWESFRQQIPAGLNYMATGNPYWTVDVGCFFTRDDPRWFYKGEFPDGVSDDNYKEFYTRMFQWATFLPVLRSHGTDTPREIWRFGEPGTTWYDAILKMINTRYTLLPYIYSMAAMQHGGDYTMARPLAFDFAGDTAVYDIKDQYMFGDMMVCPVTYPGVDAREVYLPAVPGGWIDYHTGARYDGGRSVTAASPVDVIPVFVRAGSIIPTAAPVQHSGQLGGRLLTVTVYPGADAEFVLYADAGDNYDFENGECQRVTFTWNDRRRELTIRDDGGTYAGAPFKRIFNLRTIGKNKSKTISYTGKSTTVRL
ncbi:MAG: glycoside hydrolase family 31 protein [Muribaculaceae bacterium]|nr:glycoside hydrolase family 31 protein [Muribaculaceae bacterium]